MRLAHPFAVALSVGLCLAAAPAIAGPISDPTADVFGVGPVRPDITSVDGSLTGGGVQFTVTYAGGISAPSAFAGNSLTGYIDIDTDQNAATGGTAPWGGPVPGGNNWMNFFIGQGLVPGPTLNLGGEYYIDLMSESFQPGFVDVYSTATGSSVGTVAISFGANSFTLTVPLALLGGDNGSLNFGVLTGTYAEPTDRAPNLATPYSVVVPEPATLLVFGAGLLGAAGYGWRRSRRVAAAV